MKKYLVFAGALLATLAVGWAAQVSTASIRQVRDPVQLRDLLNTNAADAESRIAVIEAIDGGGGALAPGYIVVGNASTVSAAVAVSGAMTLDKNGVATLVGNIPVASITNAFVATLQPAYASGVFSIASTTQLVFIASGVTNVIDADITTP